MNIDTLLLLTLQRMRFLKTSEKLIVMKHCSSAETLPGKKDLIQMIGRSFTAEYNRDQLLIQAENDISIMLKMGINILFIGSDTYPYQLKEIYNPPFILFYRGILPQQGTLNISVVGTRKATGIALKEAYALSFDLARSGSGIISGLAAGIDSAAHKGAIAGKSYTAAVFGCGIDRIYPSANKDLASSILDNGGALLSEYPPGTIPARYNFPERNRIVSALSEAVVVVESPLNSGALITADFALEQGREVFVLHIPSETAAGAGTMNLIKEGASSVSTAIELLNSLSYKTEDLKSRININHDYDSLETGRFLAARFLAELRGKEICREGTYYSL
ncbi:MAG: DNA-processing protein DprA [Spirochaetaceae bacterium]|jgi:DNA processing protein|nr:DNA-processing protein DprA [Spirochaetaceae bacterium]